MRKRAYKLIAYLGYREKMDREFELYNLEDDPDELHDLASKDVSTLVAMREELFAYLDTANRSFAER